MSAIIIPKNYLNKNSDWYLNFIKNNKFYYVIDNRNVFNIIKEIEENNDYFSARLIEKNLLFFIYKFIQSGNIENPINFYKEGGKPENGFEFSNPKNGKKLGVYHCHLSSNNGKMTILIWYPIFNKRFSIKFIYLDNHPSDNYENILEEIYNKGDDGYHDTECDYLINLKKLLPFEINEIFKIKKFKEF